MSTTLHRGEHRPWAIGIIVLFAFALRVYGLDHHNIWGDEAFSIALSKQPLAQVVTPNSETLPPLYHALLHFWLPLTGDSIFAVRYFSVLPGVLLVSLVYALGRQLGELRTALVAAGLTSLSSFAIYYSQETRMYAWVAVLSTLSVCTSLRLCRRSLILTTTDTYRGLAFFAATLTALFTHYYAFLVLLAQNLFLLWHKRQHPAWLRRWLALQAAIGLAYLPWILAHITFIGSKASTRLGAWGHRGMDEVWAGTLRAFGVGTTVQPILQWVASALLIFVAIGLVHSWKGPGQQRFLIPYLVIPLLGAWLVGPLMPFFYERYLIVVLPAYLLLLASGLLAAGRPLLIGGLTLAMVGNGFSLRNYHNDPRYAKGGYGDLMSYVLNHAQPGDGLLLQNGAQAALYEYYGAPNIPAYNMPPWDDPETQQILDHVTAQHPRMWLVMHGDPMGYDPDHELERWLSERAFRAYQGDYVDGSLDLYLQDNTLPTQLVEAHFGDLIGLTRYGLSTATPSPGGSLQLVLAWRALDQINRDYTIFAHVIDTLGEPWAQADSQPFGGSYPTSAWIPGTMVVERISLQLDPDTPPGCYQVQVGWYDLASMERLPAAGSDARVLADRVLLGPITVEQPR